MRNTEKSLTYIEKYKQTIDIARAGGGEKAIERHTKRNKKLLIEDRLKLLLDDDADLLELSANAGIGMAYGDVPRAGVFTGSADTI